MNILKWINWKLMHRCPECDYPMKMSFLDMQFDKVVYECLKCKKEWI